ncbi:unannotated protein [freshwater metagenome]|uniref:Unannotated protein n=1 Tax=freshwater metagenome TaxID=449393 RepID=A0A6J6P2D2_9ZZZZ|nr:NAD-dependent epimerase/dehydratase family protein [Actinomycetota bacterium]MSW25679.1 NAD-dependent epimerase/dehydratase family protein [Actinomycetota bacterium]MSW33411.1 NAD-dependent epimerase/dehydratase family protein [Actinomycetota bacterium]MSX30435.1 NAD-dependent epimerase/dehydratase family protein [Actinomycetota bacterium]MSX51333.1 NAD-dependent epimerase/dehydratase family protein [Actinomycetota bacterium]
MKTLTLVTGGDGLVAHALKSVKSEDLVFVNRNDANLENYAETLNLLKRIQPTRIIHLAALVGGVQANMKSPSDFFTTNMKINLNVLEAARVSKVERLVSLISTCVFPEAGPYPLKIDSLHSGPPHHSNFGYAYAKRMLHVQTLAYQNQYQLPYFNLIPASIYGPGDNWNMDNGHVIPSLIHRAHLARERDENLIVWGNGEALREFIYSKDVASLILWSLENYFENEPLFLSGIGEVSIAKIADLISTKFKIEDRLVFDNTKPSGQFRKPSDSSKIATLHRNFEFTPIEDGISSTIEWFLDNYPTVRF